jgi:Flp pilus assembly protein TadD
VTDTAAADEGPVEVDAPSRGAQLNASTHVDRGWSLITRGEFASAEEELRLAVRLVPNDPQAMALLGWAEMLQGRHDDALLSFQRVLQAEPGHAIARVNVGYICLQKGIYGEAVEHLTRVIQEGMDRKATLYAHYYLGLLYQQREMFEDAESFLGRALALGPNLIEAYYELGRVRWQRGNRDGARQAWRDGAAASKFSPWGSRCAAILQKVEEGEAPGF